MFINIIINHVTAQYSASWAVKVEKPSEHYYEFSDYWSELNMYLSYLRARGQLILTDCAHAEALILLHNGDYDDPFEYILLLVNASK